MAGDDEVAVLVGAGAGVGTGGVDSFGTETVLFKLGVSSLGFESVGEAGLSSESFNSGTLLVMVSPSLAGVSPPISLVRLSTFTMAATGLPSLVITKRSLRSGLAAILSTILERRSLASATGKN